jgi:hypothetical protein
MWKDPIVEQIHAIRKQIAKECDYDLRRIMERLRKEEEENEGRVVYRTSTTKHSTPALSVQAQEHRR